MAYALKLHKSVTEAERKLLADRMAQFYLNLPSSYYKLADEAAQQYNWGSQPFHSHLITLIEQGDKVVEVGCGTAHLCRFIQKKGAIYHGLDYAEDRLEENRQKFPKAFFYSVCKAPVTYYDFVVSLYTIEHVPDPIAYLEQLWSYCRPGGKIGIICPEFIDGDGFPGSVYFGRTPRRLREKLRSFSLLDCFLHLIDLYFTFPLWKKRARDLPAGAFWINLDPRDLLRDDHIVDGDAVHFPRLKDLREYFKSKGAMVIASVDTLKGIDSRVLKHNTYIVVQKPFGHST